jgi:protein-tyrosine phosphatase
MQDIFWIQGDPAPTLAVVLRPRGAGWLEGEMVKMKKAGIETVVSLLEQEEAELLALADEGPLSREIGLQFLSFPIPDTQIPENPAAFRAFVSDLAERLHRREHIGVHCRGSIGRSTVTAACALIHLGWTPRSALDAVAKARGCAVPDTREQEEWILHYQALP